MGSQDISFHWIDRQTETEKQKYRRQRVRETEGRLGMEKKRQGNRQLPELLGLGRQGYPLTAKSRTQVSEKSHIFGLFLGKAKI